MYESSTFCIKAWWFRQEINDAVFIELRAVVELSNSARGEA
jgi:hypothetical protein